MDSSPVRSALSCCSCISSCASCSSLLLPFSTKSLSSKSSSIFSLLAASTRACRGNTESLRIALVCELLPHKGAVLQGFTLRQGVRQVDLWEQGTLRNGQLGMTELDSIPCSCSGPSGKIADKVWPPAPFPVFVHIQNTRKNSGNQQQLQCCGKHIAAHRIRSMSPRSRMPVCPMQHSFELKAALR